MKRIYILLIIFLLITGCNVTKELKYKTYDLNYQEELNGKYEIIKDYNLYEKLLITRNINKSYDQDFFESSFLIAVYVDEICNESPTSVSRFKIFDGNLELYLKSSLMGITGEIKTKLFLLELESSYLNKFETVKIFKNDQEIKKENYEFSYNFIACGIANNKFDGKTMIIDSYDEYLDSANIKMINNRSYRYDEEYFKTNGLVVFRFTNSLLKDNNICKFSILNNTLYINANSCSDEDVLYNYFCFVEIDQNDLNKFNKVKVFLNNETLLYEDNQYSYMFYEQENMLDSSYNGMTRVINSFEELEKYTNKDNVLNDYQDFDFESFSLICFNIRQGYKMNDVDLWYEVKEDLLQIHYQSIDESMLAVSQQYFVCVGVSRSLLESINDIDIVKHDIYDYAETTYNVDEYNNIHLYKYSYFPTNIDILPSEKVLINSHDDLSKYLNTLYSNNYALDYFEKGIVLAYVISVPDNYTVGNPIYKVEKDVLRIQVSYLEFDYAADNVESFIIIIDSYKENLINIQTIELEMIHYE